VGVRRGCRVLALFRFDLIVAERLQDGFGGLLALGWPLVHRLAAVVVLAAAALQFCGARCGGVEVQPYFGNRSS
jgi:hypothetical protein